MDNVQRRATSRFGLAILAVAATLLAARRQNGGATRLESPTSTSGCTDCGTLLVGVTDADGDFVSYSVDVQSVTLKRPNGATVETLPATTRIDFAQLTDLADLLAVATVAPGDFVGGTIRLDYTNAEIFVEKAGLIVPAKPVDENGKPLGVVDLQVDLSNRDHLVITRGRAAFLSLDFDLDASNEVDLTQNPVVVEARPFIVAEVQPVDEKDLRLRGTLVSVNTTASTYLVDVRPWQRRDGAFGEVTVHTTGQTTFEISGTAYTGAAGLAALAQQPAGTLTAAFGTLAVQSHEFTADIVHAGDSVGGQRTDAVHGSVVARKGVSDRRGVRSAPRSRCRLPAHGARQRRRRHQSPQGRLMRCWARARSRWARASSRSARSGRRGGASTTPRRSSDGGRAARRRHYAAGGERGRRPLNLKLRAIGETESRCSTSPAPAAR
jgi:hypothetical protein